ncbi:DgyrCDS10718 [Dimorphilus gyrociliatus]|uniref:DgyrCDS10718 n=1 Tax=Dimorphilus gyrociliatus TaxID=2664684 RepID=A0A7I8W3K9_9ANNE|nr:DgyrCDS10718 [Dimorphilus gyrociliatus]
MSTEDYKFTLEAKYLKKAKDELNENDSDRMDAIEALKNWINEQKHLKYPTGKYYTINLLRILRYAKFSQIKARQTIENVIQFAFKYPDIFFNIDTTDETFLKIAKTGHCIPLPGYDDEGRKVLLFRSSALPFEHALKEYGIDAYMRSFRGCFLSLFQDEMTQINGVVLILDMTGLSLRSMTKMNDPKFKSIEKDSQEAIIGRLKSFHFYNIGGLFEAFFTLCKAVMKKKLIERVKVHVNLETMYSSIPKRMLPDEYLSDDYTGPSAGSIQHLIDLEVKRLTSEKCRNYVQQQFKRERYFYDPNLKPRESTVVQHFRKLNVD